MSKSTKCLRDIRKFPPASYRLPDDGRKWKPVCEHRRALAIQIASHANGDGTSITAGVETWADALGIHRATIFRLLDDLYRVGPGLLTNEGRVEGRPRGQCTMRRSIHVEVLRMPESESQIQVTEVADSPDPKSQIRPSKSHLWMRHNRPPYRPKPPPSTYRAQTVEAVMPGR